jgi:hypothetical protein
VYANATPDDELIISNSNASYWNPMGYVVVYASAPFGGIPGTATNYRYPIHYWDTSGLHQRICVTTSHVGTMCGQVLRTGYSCVGQDSSGHLIVTTSTGYGTFAVPMPNGDSGSPLYAANTAYGMVINAFDDGGYCYVGISRIQTQLHVGVLAAP